MIVYFVSGHLDIRPDEFQEHYMTRLQSILERENDVRFVVGDAPGTDAMTQAYLQSKNAAVTVYHMFDRPRHNHGAFPTRGGFKSDTKRDAAMTRDSDEDIAWVRPVEEQKKLYGKKYDPKRISGTQRNLSRRLKCNKKS